MRDSVLDATLDLALGIGFSLGCVLVYIPQHLQCIRQRTAEGLSIWTILLCTVSNVTLLLASLLADFDKINDAYHAENEDLKLRLLHALNEATPSLQNFLSILTGIPTYAIYYFCFTSNNTNRTNNTVRSRPDEHHHEQQHRWEVIATGVTWVLCGTATAITIWALLMIPDHQDSTFINELVKFWGATAAVTNAVQWIPQIECTWSAGHEGVLSLAALVLAVVGDGLLGLFWVESTDESPWICATLGSDAVMQFILIVLLVHYRRKRSRDETSSSQQQGQQVRDNDNDLGTPLLQEEHAHANGDDVSIVRFADSEQGRSTEANGSRGDGARSVLQ